MDCSPPDASIHGTLQPRILELVAIPFSRGYSQPRDRTWVSCITGGFFTIWVIREAPNTSTWLVEVRVLPAGPPRLVVQLVVIACVTKLGLLNGWLRSIESWVNEGRIFKMLQNNVYNLRHESKDTGMVMNISGKTKANSRIGIIQWICKTTKKMEERRHCGSRSTDKRKNKSHSIMDRGKSTDYLTMILK